MAIGPWSRSCSNNVILGGKNTTQMLTAILGNARWMSSTIIDNHKTSIMEVIFSTVFFSRRANVSTHVLRKKSLGYSNHLDVNET